MVEVPFVRPTGDAQDVHFTMYGSMFLIGAAFALGGGVGVLMPPGYRSGVVLALLVGAGVGVASLAIGWAFLPDDAAAEDWWRVFFASSIVGFAAVTAVLVVAWRRARLRSLA